MPADSPLESRIRRRLARLEARGLLRAMRPPAGIDLSSNDYLNLAHDPRIRSAFIAGIEREGCGSTGSRLLRGDRDVFAAVERQFAEFKGAERSLLFSSGYLANLAVLGGLPEGNDVIFVDEGNHASLFDGARLSRAQVVMVPHNDVACLSELLDRTPCDGVRFVAVESLYSMDGTMAPIEEYAALCRARHATLIIDEAHAVGIYGERGSGLIEQAGVDPCACISINPAGKALGAGGAFVAGSAWIVEYLVQRARTFVFSTATPPALADALQASLTTVRDEPGRRQAVRARATYLRRLLRTLGFDVADGPSQIIPVVIGENDAAVAVARAIQAEGFDVRAIRPPTVPRGTARLRLSINAGLSEETLDRFADVLLRATKTEPVPAGARQSVLRGQSA